MTQCGKAANTPDMRLHINMPAIQPQAVTPTQWDPTFKALWSGHVASQPELSLSSQRQSPFAKRTMHTRSVHLSHPRPADPLIEHLEPFLTWNLLTDRTRNGISGKGMDMRDLED